jgi:hypothetical protein
MKLALTNPQATEATSADVMHIFGTNDTVIHLNHDEGKVVATLHLAEAEAEHLFRALADKFDGYKERYADHGKRMVIAGAQSGSTIVDKSNIVDGGNHAYLPSDDAPPVRPAQGTEVTGGAQGELVAGGMQTAPGSTDVAKASASPASTTTAGELDGTSESNAEEADAGAGKTVVAADNA